MTLAIQTIHATLGLRVALALVVGLFIGSFLNVVVYRTPRHLSVSTPRSFCPICHRQLTGWENIPVASWLALRGRCHGCASRISVRYPLVEAATATGFGLVTWAWGGTAPAIGYCALAATLLAVLLIDAGELRSPLGLAAIGTAIGDGALLAAFAWGDRWSLLVGAQIGVALGVLGIAALRRRDPGCDRPTGIGRSALLPAGCWLGGLGWRPAAVGLAVGCLAFLAALVLARIRRSGTEKARGAPLRENGRVTARVIDRPLLPAIAVGVIAGLLAFA